MPLNPILHALAGSFHVGRSDLLRLVPDPMDGDDSLASTEEPDDSGVQLSKIPKLEQTILKCFRERGAMVPRVPQPFQFTEDIRVLFGIRFF